MQAAMGTLTAVGAGGLRRLCGVPGTAAWSRGNFALLLMLATLVTGLYWLAERLYFLPARRKAAQQLVDEQQQRQQALAAQGFGQADAGLEAARQKLLAQPWWLDWTAGLFPVILSPCSSCARSCSSLSRSRRVP